MTWIPALILITALLGAVWFDTRFRRIPNNLILAGLAASLAWQVLGPEGVWSFDPVRAGATGATGWFLGALALLLSLLPLYGLRVMGAGDVKLMALIGSIFGVRADAWVQLPAVMVFVLAAGGLLAIVRILALRSGAAVVANLRLIFSSHAARAAGQPGPVFDAGSDSVDRMPYAVAIAAGTLFYVVGKWTGWLEVL